MKQRILITGGLGFIGGNLFLKLKEDYDILVIDNLSHNSFNTHDKHRFCDVRNFKNVRYVFETFLPNIVIHLAGNVSIYECNKSPDDAFEINFNATRNITDLCVEFNCLLLFAETSAVYEGVTLPSIGYTENETFPITTYAVSKHCAYLYIHSQGKLNNLKYIVFRPFNVTGPYLDFKRTVPPLFAGVALRLLIGKPAIFFGDENRKRDFIHVDDVTEFISRLIVSRNVDFIGEVFNIGCGRSYSLKHIYNVICEYLSEQGFDTSQCSYINKPEINGEAFDIFANTFKTSIVYTPTRTIKDMVCDTLNFLIDEIKFNNVDIDNFMEGDFENLKIGK